MTLIHETRGRGRVAAANYVGVGLTKFDEMVADGRMPQPRKADTRLVWDVYELDAAFEALPQRGQQASTAVSDDIWTRMAA